MTCVVDPLNGPVWAYIGLLPHRAFRAINGWVAVLAAIKGFAIAENEWGARNPLRARLHP